MPKAKRPKRPPKPKRPPGIDDTYEWWPEKEGKVTIDPETGLERGRWVLS